MDRDETVIKYFMPDIQITGKIQRVLCCDYVLRQSRGFIVKSMVLKGWSLKSAERIVDTIYELSVLEYSRLVK